MSDNLFNTGESPVAEIIKGFTQGVHRHQLEEHSTDLKNRETMAKKFEDIQADDTYDEPERNMARDYAIQLRMLHPQDKLPKEFEPDKTMAKHLGTNGFAASPAWIRVTRKKILKNGPSEPKEPAPPPDPTADTKMQQGPPEMPDVSALGPLLFNAQGGNPNQPAAAAKSAPAPTPAASAAPPPPAAAPSGGAPPPPPPVSDDQYDYVSSRMSPVDRAKREAQLANIKNSIPDDVAESLGVPKGTSLKLVSEMRLKAQAASTQLLNEAKAENEKARTLHEQASIETDKVKAAAMMKAADAHMVAANAAMERASNPQLYMMPVLNEKGEITGSYGAPKVPGFTPSTAIPDGGRRTPVNEDERKSAANIDDMLTREIPALRALGEKYKDWLGPIAGNAMKLGTNWSDSLPPDVYSLVVKSANLTMERIYEMSGKQINESEAKRLADVLTNPATPYPKWISALDELQSKLQALRKSKAVPQTSTAPPPPPNVTLPPVEQRVAGQTHANINGEDRVWNGTGWAKIKK